MPDNILLAICGVLVAVGVVTIVVSGGFFMNLLGAGMMGAGSAAAYLILSHRYDRRRRETGGRST